MIETIAAASNPLQAQLARDVAAEMPQCEGDASAARRKALGAIESPSLIGGRRGEFLPKHHAENVRAYLSHLGARHQDNADYLPGGSSCGMLHMRCQVYEAILQQARRGRCRAHNSLLARFLPEEIECLRRSQELSIIQYYTFLRISPPSSQTRRLFFHVLAGEPPQRRSLSTRLRLFVGRDFFLLRLCSWRVNLYLRRQEAIWRWLLSAEPSRGELHVPIFFFGEKSSRSGSHPTQKAQPHVAYIGILVRTQAGRRVLHFRLDDEWHGPETRIVPKLDGEPGGRPKTSSLAFQVDQKAMTSAWARKKLQPLLECSQFSRTDFREHIVALAKDADFHALGGAFVPPHQQARTIAIQQGNLCSLKNHSRGVAARLEDFVGRTSAGDGPDHRRTQAHAAWQTLKAEERIVAQVLLAPPASGDGGSASSER